MYEGEQDSEFVYFILSGEVNVVRKIQISVSEKTGVRQYALKSAASAQAQCQLHVDQSSPEDQRDQKEPSKSNTTYLCSTRLWIICTLRKGMFYGVGERMDDTYLVAKERAAVVQIPKSQFIKYGKATEIQLLNLKESLNEMLPTDEALFEHFLLGMNREQYKENLLEEDVRNRKFRINASPQDVPASVQELYPSVFYALKRWVELNREL